MEQIKSRWSHTISCMKSPSFLLTLGLVNFVLVVALICGASKMHREFREESMGYGQEQGQMMHREFRGNVNYNSNGYQRQYNKSMMNNGQEAIPPQTPPSTTMTTTLSTSSTPTTIAEPSAPVAK